MYTHPAIWYNQLNINADDHIMAKTYQITPQRRFRQLQHVLQVGDAETINIDFSSWVKDNAAIDSATWTIKSGNVSLSTPSTASNVTTCTITTDQMSRARIVIKAVSGSQTISITLLIKVIEPQDIGTYDYGFIV